MHEDSTEEKQMKRQQKMKVMKGVLMKIRSKGRMDDENRWWVAELRRKMYEMHQHRVNQMIKSAKAVLGFCTKSRSLQHGEEEPRF